MKIIRKIFTINSGLVIIRVYDLLNALYKNHDKFIVKCVIIKMKTVNHTEQIDRKDINKGLLGLGSVTKELSQINYFACI